MKQKLFSSLATISIIGFSVLLTSCGTPKYLSFEGCPTPKSCRDIEKSSDIVWDNVIDFFATNNLPIQTIEKVSGIIVSGETSLTATYWTADGGYRDSDAFIAVQYRTDVERAYASANWNVRVKQIENNKTNVCVNLATPKIKLVLFSRNLYGIKIFTNPLPADSWLAKSTGVFEGLLFDYFSK